MTDPHLTSRFSDRSYWLDSMPPMPARRAASLPEKTDVLVVGAGLTGLTVAWRLASAGRSVLVLDAAEPGEGASSRNAGMLGRNTKHSFLGLQETSGLQAAKDHFGDLQNVFLDALERIRREDIRCSYQQEGRLMLAATPKQFEGIKREFDARSRHLGESSEVIDRSALAAEVGSDFFVGAVLIHDNAAVHAGQYMQAFLRMAEDAGATIVGDVAVTQLRSESHGFLAQTARGNVAATDVVICTNGHTGSLVPWARRRLIVMDSFIAATEPLPAHVSAEILPRNRTYFDSAKRPVSMRLSSDGTRLLFGARTGEKPDSASATARLLHQDMVEIFPQLKGYRLANGWGGRCALTWDFFPHVGSHDGIYYALGYNFSGLAMAPFLGEIVADQILGRGKSSSRFATRPFPKAFWPARAFDSAATRQVIRYYGFRDRKERRVGA